MNLYERLSKNSAQKKRCPKWTPYKTEKFQEITERR